MSLLVIASQLEIIVPVKNKPGTMLAIFTIASS
jgi:hypothetical protein